LVAGGRLQDEQTLEQAVEARVRGIIAGSVNAELCPFLQSLPFPVLITEGFGSLPMSQRAFSLLQANMGREAILNADIQIRRGVTRPEVFIPLRAEEDHSPEEPRPLPLQVGAQVRVLRAPYQGMIGTIVDLPALPQRVESGAWLPGAMISPEEGEPVFVPLANLEIIR
jgi:hypothetical protein